MIIGIPPSAKKYIGESLLILQVVVAGQMSSEIWHAEKFSFILSGGHLKKCEVHIMINE